MAAGRVQLAMSMSMPVSMPVSALMVGPVSVFVFHAFNGTSIMH
jgi:hypothetical protein